MHMADALLSPAVGLAMDAVGVIAIGVSAAGVKKDELSEKKIPIMGVAGAMVFAGQMINFAIPGTGSSGHIGGGILLAGLLGGAPAFLSIAAVLIIQCLFFADGGLLALGSNIFNMGAIPCLLVYPLVFRPLLKRGVNVKRLSAASVISAVIALELGAFLVVLQTTLSGITALPFGAFTALMLPIHLAIGAIEGIVTAAILCFVYKMRPEIIDSSITGGGLDGVPTRKILITLAALTIIAGGVLSLFASKDPDGLEWAASRTAESAVITSEAVSVSETGASSKDALAPEAGGTDAGVAGGFFDAAANIQENTAFLPDYSFAADPDDPVGTSLSGLIGAAIAFALACAAGVLITAVKKRKRRNA